LITWPAIVNARFIAEPVVFAPKVMETLPFPTPLLPDEMNAADDHEYAIQLRPAAVVTESVIVPPAPGIYPAGRLPTV
jgi:hypothetical protein